jgi:hypothetical protein
MKPENNVVACLTVNKILAIPQQSGFEPLLVEWEQALTNDGAGGKILNTRPGAEGHAGITGLNQGGGGRMHKNQRKDMRTDLADVSDLSPVPVPHNIPEEHIRIAAYFIHENCGDPGSNCEADWVRAIRQLRRARMNEYKSSL